jgi:hypothetical protein
MTKNILLDLLPGDLVTVPTDLGYMRGPSKERTTYRFVEYIDEKVRCIVEDLETGRRTQYSLGWIQRKKRSYTRKNNL